MKHLLFIFLFISSFIFSCNNKNSKIEDCKTCKVEEHKNGVLKFNFLNNKSGSTPFAIKLKYWHYEAKGNDKEHYISFANKDEILFQNILSYFETKKYLLNKKDVLAVILYVNKEITDTLNLKDINVHGFSVYKKLSCSMQHTLYKKEGDTFVEITKKSFKETFVSTNKINPILLDLTIFGENIKSYIAIAGDELSKYEDILENTGFNYSKISPSIIKNEMGRYDEYCGRPCYAIDGSKCRGWNEHGSCHTKHPNDCYCCASQIQSPALARGENINFSLMYDFRDNFMMKYTLGQTYTVRYYELSEVLEKKITLDIALKTLDALGKFYVCMDMLLKSDQYQNTILVNNSLKTELLNLLDEYKTLSNDTRYVTTIEKIKTDVNQYSNKTVSEFIDLIK